METLAVLYPGSDRVRNCGLERADDQTVWEFALARGFTIVSKDSDFHQRSFPFGFPPKVVWIRSGNCPTSDIERILKEHSATAREFCEDRVSSFLVLP